MGIVYKVRDKTVDELLAVKVLPLDRVYVRNLEVRSSKVLRGGPFRNASDHLPLTVTAALLQSSPEIG